VLSEDCDLFVIPLIVNCEFVDKTVYEVSVIAVNVPKVIYVLALSVIFYFY